MLSKAKIKFITSLKLKKHRNEQQLFIAEGEKIVRELLQSSSFVREVYATEAWITSNSNLIARSKIAAEVITEQELRKISMLITPHNVLAICSIPNVTYTEGNIKQELCLALDNIQDPGNMGTIIRIADWFNIPF